MKIEYKQEKEVEVVAERGDILFVDEIHYLIVGKVKREFGDFFESASTVTLVNFTTNTVVYNEFNSVRNLVEYYKENYNSFKIIKASDFTLKIGV